MRRTVTRNTLTKERARREKAQLKRERTEQRRRQKREQAGEVDKRIAYEGESTGSIINKTAGECPKGHGMNHPLSRRELPSETLAKMAEAVYDNAQAKALQRRMPEPWRSKKTITVKDVLDWRSLKEKPPEIFDKGEAEYQKWLAENNMVEVDTDAYVSRTGQRQKSPSID